MSYAAVKPEYYQMLQPDSPWHAGAPGWSSAPWPGWGENPNLVGPPRLATNGLGGGCGCGGGAVGEEVSVAPAVSVGLVALGLAIYLGGFVYLGTRA